MSAPLLLAMEGISKTYPGVQALSDVSLELARGEVLALLGENGAGKSTLMKILGGAVRPDAGRIVIDGVERPIRSPHDALRAGVAVIHQEFNLVPGLGAADNIFLGQEIARGPAGLGWIDRRAQRRRAESLLARLGADFDADTPCRSLSVARQQLVEIAKALAAGARILVMDEPSAALTRPEVTALHGVIRELKGEGTGIVYVSHRLEEIAAVCDRVAVLRDGRTVGGAAVAEVDRGDLIRMMVGRDLVEEFPRRTAPPGGVRLVVEGLARGAAVRGVSFEARGGEILALTGLVGSGRTEVLRLLFGADRKEAGTIRLDGTLVDPRSPRAAIAAGIGLLPEDRKLEGLVLGLSVRENFSLPSLARFSRGGIVRRAAEREACGAFVADLRIKTPRQETAVRSLSGGNQQKVVLAKWLERRCEVLLFDEPTRGVDVGAKVEIYQLMNELAAAGKVVVMVSSDLPEVLGMADRILVMHDGRITGRIDDAAKATQESIMEMAVA
jgi:ABC-type branched-subunit amino acid transport system ATPase component